MTDRTKNRLFDITTSDGRNMVVDSYGTVLVDGEPYTPEDGFKAFHQSCQLALEDHGFESLGFPFLELFMHLVDTPERLVSVSKHFGEKTRENACEFIFTAFLVVRPPVVFDEETGPKSELDKYLFGQE